LPIKLSIAGALVAAGVIAAGACSRREEQPAVAPVATTAPAPAAAPDAGPAVVAPTLKPRTPRPREPEKLPDVSVPLRKMDRQIFALLKGGADKKKVAKAFSRAAPKVTVDARAADQPARVVIDLDGDGRSDEEWRVEPGGQAVRTARARNEVRDDVFHLEGEQWKLVAGTGKSATQEVVPPAPLRPFDKVILAKAGKPDDEVADATPGKPYRVQLSKEMGSKRLNRAKVDLDRDGKWDETWWMESSIVRRNVSPRDDGNYPDRYRLVNGKWYIQ
jgi:hypothetical protein